MAKAGANGLILRCLSLGPRANGRDYGLLPRFREHPLPERTGGPLGDFALAMLEWGFEPRPPFSAFFPLGPRHHLLARVAYLKRETLGPVVLANALLIDNAGAAAADGRAHRLLGTIRDPKRGEWDRLEIEVEEDDFAAILPRPALSDFCHDFRASIRSEPVRVEVAEGSPPEQVVAEILEGAHRRQADLPAWSTSAELSRVGSFDPSRWDLVVVPVDPTAPRVSGSFRLDQGGISGPKLRQSQALRLIYALLGSHAAVPPGGITGEASGVVAGALGQALAEQPDDEHEFWRMLEDWATRANGFADKDALVAQLAIALAFRTVLERPLAPAVRARLLSGYRRRIWHRLPKGPAALPASLALRLELLEHFSPDDLEWLAGHGLVATFAAQAGVAVRTAGLSGAQLASLARILRPSLSSAADDPGTLDFAQAIVGRAADRDFPVAPGTEDDERELLALGEAAMLAAGDWRELSETLTSLLVEPRDQGAAATMVRRVKESLAGALYPPDAVAVRRAWTAAQIVKRLQHQRRAA